MKTSLSVDEYLSEFSGETRVKLEKLRKLIHEIEPSVTESIVYGIPTFKTRDKAVHIGGYKAHVALYPTPKPIEVFKEKLKGFKTSKGAIQFPLDKELPFQLIAEIVEFRFTSD